MLISVMFKTPNAAENNIYQKKKIYCSMAGSGDPWSALTKPRRPILLAMHDGLNIERLAEVFDMSVEQMISEIKPLLESNLVKAVDNKVMPNFFVANLSETKKVYSHSKTTGKLLAEALVKEWDKLERSFSELSISKFHSLKEQGFMFIGARILDIGVLGALVRDKSLLTTVPSRPSPERPHAQYYFWMVEGEPEHLGKFGQDDTDLSRENWHLLNFGQSVIDGKLNLKRRFFENRIAATLKSIRSESPELLAKKLDVPFLDKKDSERWEEVSRSVSSGLLKILKINSSGFIKFYDTLRASEYTNNSFGEFFCWYYHLAFAWAIETLKDEGAIVIPPDGYSAIVMYREGPEGLLSK